MKVYDGGTDENTYVGMAAFGANPTNLGILVREKDVQRMLVGKSMSGHYELSVNASTGQPVAGIGESNGGSGVMTLGNTDGHIKAQMYLDPKGGGAACLANSGGSCAIELGVGPSGAGQFIVANAGGKTLVDAGQISGVGVIRAYPLGSPGAGLVGMPGTFLMGRK